MAPEPPRARLTQALPFLAVSDMQRSLRFYVEGLGFERKESWMDAGSVRWCRLERDGVGLMLQDFRREGGGTWAPPGPLGLGVSLVFLCDDALALYRASVARGLQASRPFVGNGMWVTGLRDPDGYDLQFESATDAPEDTRHEG